MNGVDIAVIVIVCAAVAAVVGWFIYRKLKHKKIGCDCCGDCKCCDLCRKEDKK